MGTPIPPEQHQQDYQHIGSAECSSRGMTCTSLRVSIGKVPTKHKKYLMVWNIAGVVQVKIVVKVRGQHIGNRTYTGAQTIKTTKRKGSHCGKCTATCAGVMNFFFLSNEPENPLSESVNHRI